MARTDSSEGWGRGHTLFKNFVPETQGAKSRPDRLQLASSVLFPLILKHGSQLEHYRQLALKEESSFVNWARELDVPISGVYWDTDVDILWRNGWMRADQTYMVSRSWKRRYVEPPQAFIDKEPLGAKRPNAGRWTRYEHDLHPFRLYPALKLLQAMEWRLTRSSVLYGPGVRRYADDYVRQVRKHSKSLRWREQIDWWNGIADLAILLEPLYWPSVTNQVVSGVSLKRDEAVVRRSIEVPEFESYRRQIMRIVRRIHKGQVAHAHLDLRIDAALMDGNAELYLLLRSSSWSKRGKITGRLGAAMWLRHMAEVIRHGFDALYSDRLVHEDEALGTWIQGAREWVYGSEYPLEDIAELQGRVLPRWGWVATARVRFYVEGDTEEGALEAALQAVLGSGVEVVNLGGRGWDTWLKQQLELDCKAKRLSMIMLDGDRKDFVESVKRRAREGVIVGMVFVNRPDIESSCFTSPQLVQAVRYYEQMAGLELPEFPADELLSVPPVQFVKTYCRARQVRSLKSKQWGAALMRVAIESVADDMDESNPLVHAFKCALRGIKQDYEVQSKRYRIDPDTLLSVETDHNLFGGGR